MAFLRFGREKIEKIPLSVAAGLFALALAVPGRPSPYLRWFIEHGGRLWPILHRGLAFKALFGAGALTVAALWVGCANVAARLLDGKGRLKTAATGSLILLAIATLSVFALPIAGLQAVTFIGLWLLSGIAVTAAAYDLSPVKASLATVFGGLASGIIFFIATSVTVGLLIGDGHSLAVLRAPTFMPLQATADPAWRFRTIDGESRALGDYRGEVVVLNFWATWCTPCRLEMDSLQRLSDQLKEEGVVVVGISDEAPAVLRRFLRTKSYTYPMFSQRGARPSVFRSSGIPVTFILSKTGEIVAKVEGAARWDDPTVLSYLRTLTGHPQLLGKPGTAYIFNEQAARFYRLGRLVEAEQCFRRAIEMATEELGDSAPLVATALNGLGSVYYSRQNFAAALPLHEEAVAIWRKNADKRLQEALATGLTNLAKDYRHLGRIEEAEHIETERQNLR